MSAISANISIDEIEQQRKSGIAHLKSNNYTEAIKVFQAIITIQHENNEILTFLR